MVLNTFFSIGLIWLGAVFIGQVFYPSAIRKSSGWFLWSGIAAVLLAAVSFSVYQYYLWHGNPLSRYLLPPYASAAYFLFYVLSRIIGPWLISIAAALAVRWFAITQDRKRGGRFFEKGEADILGLCLALSGYPGFLLMIIIVSLAAVFWSAFHLAKSRGRAPLWFLWCPTGLAAILITYFWLTGPILNYFNL